MTVALPPMTEGQLLEHVRTVAQLYGWRMYHTHDSRRSAAGFPDPVLVRPPRLIFAELKRDVGPRGGGPRLTPNQQAWLDDLRLVAGACGRFGARVEAHVWRPTDLEEIARALA